MKLRKDFNGDHFHRIILIYISLYYIFRKSFQHLQFAESVNLKLTFVEYEYLIPQRSQDKNSNIKRQNN